MIDVHIIRFDEPQWKIDRCLASLQGEPITVHWVEGVQEFPPNQGRALGFSKGDAPYVSYVDPDDYIEPGAFTKLLTAIQSGDYDAAYGWERVFVEGQADKINKSAHHAFVLKRGLHIDYSSEWRVFTDRSIPLRRVKEVREVLYHHNRGDR